ncbi:MAG: type II/IV secretion system ATPase subunit [Candidatus Nanoarchaeia archaeon]|nr:type II/IV secretion system ATPase subunit [Candidatus Nanoarchaeia archaeon]
MDKKIPTYGFELVEESEGQTLWINYEGSHIIPLIEDSQICMSRTIDILSGISHLNKMIFYQRRDYEYDSFQTEMLLEVAQVYKKLVNNRELFSYNSMANDYQSREIKRTYVYIKDLIYNKLKEDPIGCYVQIRRDIRDKKIELDLIIEKSYKDKKSKILNILQYIKVLLERTKLILMATPYLEGYEMGDREIYRRFFSPTIKPDFIYTKLLSTYPADAIELDSYYVGSTEVAIFKLQDTVQYLYHIIPPEYNLDEERYEILDIARNVLAEHQPTEKQFTNIKKIREIFYNIGSDLIRDLALNKDLKLSEEEVHELVQILVRYTIGFGPIELLLEDENVQDISVNSPSGKSPIFIVHSEYDDCKTNIIPTESETDSWATKLKMISGRPLDESNQLLDTEIDVENARARVSTITKPLNPSGLAFSFRRHRSKPWTLPLFLKYRTLTPLAAGFLSFVIDGARTILVCGTRSSGKSSLLSSFLVELMRKFRIITVEDTLELPAEYLRDLGYNIQQLKVGSALIKGGSEMSASDGIRSTLRLGDSALIVGEVRGEEAVALYEAMRVGAAANLVSGTIHADSPYGVYDRLVHDIGIPKTSFKATDLIVIVNPIKTASGLKKQRRVLEITEVRKHWNDDPVAENGFVKLFEYDAKEDMLKPTEDLLNGDSEILKSIASKIQQYSGNWDALWENIELRGKIKETLTNHSIKNKLPEILEADFIVLSNDKFHMISDDVIVEKGYADSDSIYEKWYQWFLEESEKYIKVLRMQSNKNFKND